MNDLWDWWQLTLSGAANHSLEPAVYWHARLMVLGWAVLIPLGVLLARYFKVTPGQDWPTRLDNKFWWHAHRSFQWLGLLLAVLGLILIVLVPHTGRQSAIAQNHASLGWALMALAGLQLISGLLRGTKGGPKEPELRGDHYDMSRRRIWFERLHKGLGWLLIGCAVGIILSGLVLADAPRWMGALLLSWWLTLLVLSLRWQASGRCIDTYQAIWGPDHVHPGNQRNPTGWGIRRPWESPHGRS